MVSIEYSEDQWHDGSYLDDEFKDWLDSWMISEHVPGMSIAVIDNGHIESKGFGLAQLPDVPATADTIFPMASTTKAFTTALVGMLIQKATCNNGSGDSPDSPLSKGWRTPVVDVLGTDFETTTEFVTESATIEDIASHRSGIPGHDLMWGPRMSRSPAVTTRCLRHLESTGGRFRQEWQYNNLMYGVLEHVIAKVTGQTFNHLLRKEILTPLSMQNTYLGIERVHNAVESKTVDKSRIARGYFWVPNEKSAGAENFTKGSGEGVYVPDQYTSLVGCEPAGALFSPVNDYAKWVRMLLKASQPDSTSGKASHNSDAEHSDNSIVTSQLWQELTTPRIQIVPTPYASIIAPSIPNEHSTPMSYALGWAIDTHMYPGELIITHGGGLPGFATGVMLLPNHNFGIVIAGNGGLANWVGEAVAKEILGRKLGFNRDRRRRQLRNSNHEPNKKSLHDEGPVKSAGEPSQSLTSETRIKDSIRKRAARLQGTYHHPAYGTIHLSDSSQSASLGEHRPRLQNRRIVREKIAPGDIKHTIRSCIPILINPLEDRGLYYRMLAHPSSTQPYDDKLIYTLETVESHGDLSQDPATDLAPGYGDPTDRRYPGSREHVWQTIGIREQALVVEFVRDLPTEDFVVGRLGLRVMRVDGAMKSRKSGDDEPDQPRLVSGWEKNMIWFQKVDC